MNEIDSANSHDSLTYPQAADLLRISVRTLGRMVRDEEIEVVRLRGQVRFTPDGIRDCITRNTVPCAHRAVA